MPDYDREWFDDAGLEVPTDLADLAGEEYEGLLAVTNPATSSPGLAFLLATIERFGEDEAFAFWEDLADADVVVTDGSSEAYYDEFSGTAGGDRPLVVSYASSPPAEVFFADPQPDGAPTGVIERPASARSSTSASSTAPSTRRRRASWSTSCWMCPSRRTCP